MSEIKSRVGNEAYKSGWDNIFKNKDPNEVAVTKIPCTKCGELKIIHYIKRRTSNYGFAACNNKDCKEYLKPPEVQKGCINKDSFSYRAGSNMSKAEDERRDFESKTPAHSYGDNEYKDLNTNDSWKEDGWDNEDPIQLSHQ